MPTLDLWLETTSVRFLCRKPNISFFINPDHINQPQCHFAFNQTTITTCRIFKNVEIGAVGAIWGSVSWPTCRKEELGVKQPSLWLVDNRLYLLRAALLFGSRFKITVKHFLRLARERVRQSARYWHKQKFSSPSLFSAIVRFAWGNQNMAARGFIMSPEGLVATSSTTPSSYRSMIMLLRNPTIL